MLVYKYENEYEEIIEFEVEVTLTHEGTLEVWLENREINLEMAFTLFGSDKQNQDLVWEINDSIEQELSFRKRLYEKSKELVLRKALD